MFKLSLHRKRSFTLLALVIAGETVFFLPFVLARIFRPTLLLVFDISNTELGACFSLYGVLAMVSYFFGGPLADRFSARNLLSIALWLTGFGGLIMWQAPSKETLFILYGFWGITTILLFWAALIRATREWGGEDLQGRAFGWLEGGRGATAAFLGTMALFVFSDFSGEPTSLVVERINSYRQVVLFTSLFTMFTGVVTWIFVPYNKEAYLGERIKTKDFTFLLKMPVIWLLSIIIVCAYVCYKITDDFSLYANEVIGVDEVKAAGFGTGALWMRAVVAVIAGYVADKIKASRIIIYCFIIAATGGVLLALGLFEQGILLLILNFIIIMVGIYGLRALYFALIHEGRIPILLTGTAVGIISIIGYTPDVFMSPWMGYLLDTNPGVSGHRLVFWVLTGFSLLGLMAALGFVRLNKPSS